MVVRSLELLHEMEKVDHAMPQPNFVPVMPSTFRNTRRSGVSPSTSTPCVWLLTLMVKAMASAPV
jgi:hypothetical protein